MELNYLNQTNKEKIKNEENQFINIDIDEIIKDKIGFLTERFENLKKATEYVKGLLININPKNGYYYHNFSHTIDVTQRSGELAKKEGLSEKETELITLGAIFHDTGFIKQYSDNEIFGAKIARDYLEKEGFKKERNKNYRRNYFSNIFKGKT